MASVEEQDPMMKAMLLDLEQAIKDFMQIAEQEGMSKQEINDFLKRECNQTVDEILKSRIIH